MEMSRKACKTLILEKEEEEPETKTVPHPLGFFFFFPRSFLHMPQGHLARLLAVVVVRIMYRPVGWVRK